MTSPLGLPTPPQVITFPTTDLLQYLAQGKHIDENEHYKDLRHQKASCRRTMHRQPLQQSSGISVVSSAISETSRQHRQYQVTLTNELCISHPTKVISSMQHPQLPSFVTSCSVENEVRSLPSPRLTNPVGGLERIHIRPARASRLAQRRPLCGLNLPRAASLLGRPTQSSCFHRQQLNSACCDPSVFKDRRVQYFESPTCLHFATPTPSVGRENPAAQTVRNFVDSMAGRRSPILCTARRGKAK